MNVELVAAMAVPAAYVIVKVSHGVGRIAEWLDERRTDRLAR